VDGLKPELQTDPKRLARIQEGIVDQLEPALQGEPTAISLLLELGQDIKVVRTIIEDRVEHCDILDSVPNEQSDLFTKSLTR
jgi:hypothetical protein